MYCRDSSAISYKLSAISFCKGVLLLQATSYKLQASARGSSPTSYKLQATSFCERIFSYKLQAISYQLLRKDLLLQATSYKLQASAKGIFSYKLKATSYKLLQRGIMFNGLLKDLAQSLKQFPGVGEKTAQRLAMFLISQDKDKSRRLAQSILDAVDRYNHCSRCNMLAESDPCPFCSDSERDTSRICVVENTADVYLIQNTHEFKGIYFVLGHLLSPLDGIGPAEINFHKLMDRIKQNQPEEIILALNPSPEGETTMNYIASQTHPLNITTTRLSTGLPFGGDIEYTSSMTLSHAFKRRMPI